MKEALNSIYLRLDVNMQYLASKAIAQIIIKILYSNGSSMSANEIKSELARINGGSRFSDKEIDDILLSLCESELKKRDGRYYLSTSRKRKIRESLEESANRQNEILQKYFIGLNSDISTLKDWLSIITRLFFESFSDEWISDLIANTHHISQSIESIRLQVTNRTESIKDIDKDDKEVLPSKFFEFVNSHDPEVEAYLWGYGTSAFASKLIRNKHGVDKLTMDAFRDSVCFFDTNVLLFIALESKYADSFKALEKVFMDLNIRPKYLYITKNEYFSKVYYQRELTLSNFDKYGYETVSMSKDDFTSLAIRLNCREKTDFESFFDFMLSLPAKMWESLDIQLMDDDLSLSDAIDKAQHDEQLKEKLNGLYRAIVGRDKTSSACHHDIGLLEGVRFLRTKEDESINKCFILSDEISVNQYSKGLGTHNGLPLALRVDTLINMLAVNNGGDTFDASDYKPLFANIIRMELIPHKDTFDQAELYQLSQMNTRISSLPSDQVSRIALQMHRHLMNGMAEQDLSRELNKLVTKGELEVKDEIRDIKNELTSRNRDNQYLSDALKVAEGAVRVQVENDYDRETKGKVKRWWIGIVLSAIFIGSVIGYLVCKNVGNSTIVASIIVGVLSSAIVSLIGGFIAQRRVISDRKEKRERFIDEEVVRRLKKS